MTLSRAFILLAALTLTGCGSTIVTRIQHREIGSHLALRQIRQEAARTARLAEISKADPDEAVRQLIDWAGDNPERIAEAATSVLSMASRIRDEDRKCGFLLIATKLAFQGLLASGVPAEDWLTDKRTQDVLATYNEALERFIIANADSLAQGFEKKEIPTPLGLLAVSTKYLTKPPYKAGYFDTFLPANLVRVRGMGETVEDNGLGVALVAKRERTPERDEEMYYLPQYRGINAPFSATVTFDGNSQARIELFDLRSHAKTTTPAGRVQLSSNYTAPLALTMRGANDLLIGIRGLFNVEKGKRDAGIYLTEPFDPNRIPILMIHGLSSSPLVWRKIAANLMGYDTIRKNYQFWYVFYPTGMPIPMSAASLRDDIEALRHRYDPKGTSRASRNMVIVGYSMGGVIAQMLATSSGDRLWNAVAKGPFDEAPLDAEDREQLARFIFWKPIPGLDRVIFIATPHRGTRFADTRLAGLGLRLISLPQDLVRFQSHVFDALGNVLQGDFTTFQAMNGINSLSPSSPIYTALATAPFAPGVKFDSIIGDRGRGGGWNSTDGIVGYWSSHLPGSQSETIVPTGHDAQTHPLAFEAIHRILLENLKAHPAR